MGSEANIFWAAFGGAAAAGVLTLIAVLAAEWFRWFLDRPLIKAQISFGFIHHQVIKDNTWYVFLEARNPHSKLVVLSTFGFYYRREEWGSLQVMPQAGFDFPYALEGGRALTQYTPIFDLANKLKETGRKPSDLKWIYFSSSAGKVFKNKISHKKIEVLQKVYDGEIREEDVGVTIRKPTNSEGNTEKVDIVTDESSVIEEKENHKLGMNMIWHAPVFFFISFSFVLIEGLVYQIMSAIFLLCCIYIWFIVYSNREKAIKRLGRPPFIRIIRVVAFLGIAFGWANGLADVLSSRPEVWYFYSYYFIGLFVVSSLAFYPFYVRYREWFKKTP